MEIRKITGVVPADKRAVEAAFDSIEPQPVACCNWPEQYPYAPEVSFRMFHTGAYLMLRFDVAERWTMARVTEDNGEVWTDSCVEFFIAPDAAGFGKIVFGQNNAVPGLRIAGYGQRLSTQLRMV